MKLCEWISRLHPACICMVALIPSGIVGVKLWISKSAPYASESVWGMSAPVFFCIVQHIQRCRKLQILASPTCVCFLSRDQCNATSCFWLYIKCRLEMRFCTPAQWHFLSQQMGSVFVLMLFMCYCVSVCVHVLLFFLTQHFVYVFFSLTFLFKVAWKAAVMVDDQRATTKALALSVVLLSFSLL